MRLVFKLQSIIYHKIILVFFAPALYISFFIDIIFFRGMTYYYSLETRRCFALLKYILHLDSSTNLCLNRTLGDATITILMSSNSFKSIHVFVRGEGDPLS